MAWADFYEMDFMKGTVTLRLVVTKPPKVYVTTIGNLATVLSPTTVWTKKLESSVVSVKTVS